MLDRLAANWVYGGVLAALLLALLLPFLTSGWSTAEILTFLCLPTYMIHQYEEHEDDRFRRFVNEELAGGIEALSRFDVFIINIIGVWAVLAGVVALIRSTQLGWGVLSADLLIVNALIHIGSSVTMRKLNPGFFTALLLFMPLGIGLFFVELPVASGVQQACGLILSVGLHAAILIHVKRVLAAER